AAEAWCFWCYRSQTAYLDGSLSRVVHTSYLDALGKAGYGVGRGTFDAGKIDPVSINKSVYLTDSRLRSTLQGDISNDLLKSPDANRLFPGLSAQNQHGTPP